MILRQFLRHTKSTTAIPSTVGACTPVETFEGLGGSGTGSVGAACSAPPISGAVSLSTTDSVVSGTTSDSGTFCAPSISRLIVHGTDRTTDAPHPECTDVLTKPISRPGGSPRVRVSAAWTTTLVGRPRLSRTTPKVMVPTIPSFFQTGVFLPMGANRAVRIRACTLVESLSRSACSLRPALF